MKTETSRKIWNRFAARYAKTPVADEESYQKKLQVTQEYFRPDMDVLEIGCGTGSTAIVHAPHVKHIRAVDISDKMLDIAQGKADAVGITNITFEQAAIDDLNVADESIDGVLGLSILHLLEEREAAIARVYQMLKPGGIFVTSTICMGDNMKFLKFIIPIGSSLGVIPMVKFITIQELVDNITEAGFEIDHQWLPGKNKAVFIVAKKPA